MTNGVAQDLLIFRMTFPVHAVRVGPLIQVMVPSQLEPGNPVHGKSS
jgi:hypothetical protein